MPPLPNFGNTVNPIIAEEADYAQHNTTYPFHGFSDLPMALALLVDLSKFAVETRYPINYPLLLGFKMFPGYLFT